MTRAAARWLVVGVPAALYLFGYFHRVAPAVVATDLMRAFAITAAALATLSAVYPYVFAAMALVAGSLADTLGPRWTMALGGIAMAAGTGVFALAPTFGVALGGRLLIAAGASVLLIAWLSLIAAWFRPDEFGALSGLTQTVGNVGALAASVPLALLVDATGWRAAFALIAALTLGVALLVLLVVRDRPEEVGQPPIHADNIRRPSVRLREIPGGVRDIVTNPRTWPPILAAGGVYSTLLTLQGLWGVPYLAQVYGLGRVEAASSLALLAVGFGVGSPLVGWLSDRWLGRRRPPMILFTAAYVACWAPLAAPDLQLPAPALGPYFFVMGLAAAGLVLVWSCVREVNDPVRVGLAVGFCNVPIFLGFALVQWLTGVILDARWAGLLRDSARVYPPEAYRAAFFACACIAISALGAVALVTETRCRNVWADGRRGRP